MDEKGIDWENIKYFLSISNEGSALAAAKKLRVNHSTVIRRIDHLEKELGVKLFSRLQKGYQLSEVGRTILSCASELGKKAEEIIVLANKANESLDGEITVSHPGNCFLNLSQSFMDFSRSYPGIKLRVINSPHVTNLNNKEAHVAIRLTDRPPESLVGREVLRSGFGVYANRDYIGRFGKPPAPDECDWLFWRGIPHATIPTVNQPDRIFSRLVPNAKIVLTSDSMEDVFYGVKAGFGVGILTRSCGCNDKDLVELPYQKLLMTMDSLSVGLWILTRKDLKECKSVKVFYDFMSNYLPENLQIPPVAGSTTLASSETVINARALR